MNDVLMGERMPTILNRGISVSDLQEIAKKTNQVINITARPDCLYISVMDADDVEYDDD